MAYALWAIASRSRTVGRLTVDSGHAPRDYGRDEERDEDDGVDERALTDVLDAVHRGDPGAIDALFSSLEPEIHALAREYMRGQSRAHTLQPTALVNEAYLRLRLSSELTFRDTAHLRAMICRVFWSVLVDHARGRNREKRRPPGERVPVASVEPTEPRPLIDLVELDDALERLADRPREVVKFAYLGLTHEEIASELKVSVRTVERDWKQANQCLRKLLG